MDLVRVAGAACRHQR
ncbi:hypothetical protein [Nocardia veterana]